MKQGNGIIVARPRVTDAIGAALRDAYTALPTRNDDFMALLRQLDTATTRPN
ncbi:hypothetical protein ACLN6N_06865 [Sphingomonas carotinifaciens]|uniref:hypothetical protein n=1 Tax=Sphingomonas TaxID=13687 RepID=UPI00226AEF86|nr:hypothetical protein [Sphingomonas sp. GM_Shp_2]